MAIAPVSPSEALRQLITGFRATHLIGAAAEFGLADFLVDGSKTAEELASLIGLRAEPLRRVMHALSQLGVFAMLEDGSFALTALGDCLRTDSTASLRGIARMWSSELTQRPMLALQHTLRTGETAFDATFGTSLFSYWNEHPAAAEIFNGAMASEVAQFIEAVVNGYDFHPFQSIVDVGGGNGAVVAAVLHAHPHIRGVVFDLPHARDAALRQLSDDGLDGRYEFVGGDFFVSVPTSADAFLLSRVIHDWDDERSVAILRSCRRAMTPQSKLLIIERLLPAWDEQNPDAVFSNISMLVMTGGCERTEEQYRDLLKSADLRLTRIVPTASSFSVLEAEPIAG